MISAYDFKERILPPIMAYYQTYTVKLPANFLSWPPKREKPVLKTYPEMSHMTDGHKLFELDGFRVKTPNVSHLEKHGLLGKGLLNFTNELCALFDNKKDELPEDELETLDYTIRHFMVRHEDGSLYHHLLENYGPEALNYNAWFHFSLDTTYYVCLQTFTDMPTQILEEYGRTAWTRRTRTLGEVGIKHVMERIGKREDMYGQMSSELAYGLLFDN